jgi:ubiquinone/menaquinone biosynthesis C-methylase UbiE
MYSLEPEDKCEYTQKNDKVYGRFAKIYDWAVKTFPVWRNWISAAIPEIKGPDVLEVSFGTGYLISQYADQFNAFGIDYNWDLTSIAKHNLQKSNVQANLLQADVFNLPYPNKTFDTVVNTMAFTGYPDGQSALKEIRRVLKDDGRFILVDIDYPRNRNWMGTQIVKLWAGLGDIIRNMETLFQDTNFRFTNEEIGGLGSVHLYIATKKGLSP